MSHSEEVTLADPEDHVNVRVTQANPASDAVDPRITPGDVADEEQLDESYLRQASDYVQGDVKHGEKKSVNSTDKEGPLYVSGSPTPLCHNSRGPGRIR